MRHLSLSLSEQMLVSMNMDTDEIIASMRQEYGLKLFREGKLTLSQSAEFSGMNLYEFMSLLTLSATPVIDYEADELEREFKQFS